MSSPSKKWSCPRCFEDLIERATARSIARGCPRCGGIWLDVVSSTQLTGALGKQTLLLAELAAHQATETPETDGVISCPDCWQHMDRKRVAAAHCVVDTCPQHGTWFDRDELLAIARALVPPDAVPVDDGLPVVIAAGGGAVALVASGVPGDPGIAVVVAQEVGGAVIQGVGEIVVEGAARVTFGIVEGIIEGIFS